MLEALDAEIDRQYAQDNKDLTEVLKPSVLRLGTSAADVVTRLINKSNVKGFTPLMLACSGGHTDVVVWLIKHGALLGSFLHALYNKRPASAQPVFGLNY